MLAEEARQLIMRYGLTGAMTRRQEQVIRLIAEGKTNAEVAGELGIARESVEAHLARARFAMRLDALRTQRTD